MGALKPSLLLFWLLVIMVSASEIPEVSEARTLSTFSSQQGYAKTLATLGVECKCCDGDSGNGELCRSKWSGSCSKLQCLPWKLS